VAKPADPCSKVDSNPWPWRSETEGKWGEDPRLVPDFSYAQERRAPKMPAAERYLNELPAAQVPALADALLICLVEVYSHNQQEPAFYSYKLEPPNKDRARCPADWDTLNAPDALLRLRFGDEYPISLFGPEDHWGFYISVPHIHLAQGQELAVKLWDRDAGEEVHGAEYIGESRLRFDGSLPFTFHSEYFAMRCNAIPSEQALARAGWWLQKTDEALKQARDFRPQPDLWDFGSNDAAGAISRSYGSASLRYGAGFVGWDHPDIQSRLKQWREIVEKDESSRQALAAKLYSQAPPVLGKHRIDAAREISITSADCHEDHCQLQAEVKSALAKELCRPASSLGGNLAGLDERGHFSAAEPELLRQGTWQRCGETEAEAEPPGSLTRVRLTLKKAPRLLWIKGTASALYLKLPGLPGVPGLPEKRPFTSEPAR
jgi:hypothetical protein